MPRDGSGNYTRPVNSVDPAVPATTISSTDFNQLTLDLATEMTDSLSRSGKGAALANLDFGTHKITNLGSPSAASDAARKDYVDNQIIGVNLAGDVTGVFTTTVVGNVAGNKVTGLTGGSFPSAGKVGEVLSAFGGPTSLTSNSVLSVATLNLTTGNWLLFGTSFHASAGGGWNVVLASIGPTINSTAGGYTVNQLGVSPTVQNSSPSVVPGVAVIAINAPTPVYLNVLDIFTGTMSATVTITGVRIS